MYTCLDYNFVAHNYRIVDPTKGYSSDQDNVSSDASEKLLVSCVLISIAFNILFIVIICFAFKKNRVLARSNHQLVTRNGLHYSRINDRMDIDEVDNNDGSSSDSSSSSSPSPVNGNDDDPMIEL